MDLLSSFSSSVRFPAPTKRISHKWTRLVVAYVARLRSLQRLCQPEQELRGLEWIGRMLRQLNITIEYKEAELRCLPAQGAYIVLANGPDGLLSKLVLLHVLSKHSPTLRVVTTTAHEPLKTPLAEQLLWTEACQTATERPTRWVRQMLRYVHNDVPLLLFSEKKPVGRAGFLSVSSNEAYALATGQLIAAARVPVVPVWVGEQRSASVRWLQLLLSLVGVAQLPAGLLSRRGHTAQVRIGQPVLPATLARLPTAGAQHAYLQGLVRTLGLPAGASVPPLPEPMPTPALVAATPAELLERDIAALRSSRCLLRYQQWEVYMACKAELPYVVQEIGRLRELTSRCKGEGTYQASDLDTYDAYYRHLFLYDRAARCLVGAYRIGLGRAIMRQHGKRGFYLHSVFRLRKELEPLLRQTLEVGQAFVRAEYQQQPLPLALLWKGMADYVATHPEYRYVVGPTTLSRQCPAVPKAALVEYIRRSYFNAELAQAVRARKPYRFRALNGGSDSTALSAYCSSNPVAQTLVAELGPGEHGMPALLRQYVKQHACLIGFYINPRCTNALQGLLVLDVRELPARAQHLLERTALLPTL